MYPYIEKLGLKVVEEPIAHINRYKLIKALKKYRITKKFNEYFGTGQTQYVDGPYPYDVEAVLVRIFENKLTGTQKFWD
jgi:hypothetical protein